SRPPRAARRPAPGHRRRGRAAGRHPPCRSARSGRGRQTPAGPRPGDRPAQCRRDPALGRGLRGARDRHPGPPRAARIRGAGQGRLGRAGDDALGPRRQPRPRPRRHRRGRLLADRADRRGEPGARRGARPGPGRFGARRRGRRHASEHRNALRRFGPPADQRDREPQRLQRRGGGALRRERRLTLVRTWLALLAAWLLPVAAHAAPVRMTMAPAAGGIRITYDLPAPVREFAIRPAGRSGPARVAHLTAAEPGLTYSRGRIAAAAPFRRFTLIITPDDAEVDSIYPLLSRVEGRGFVLYAPYVTPDGPLAASVATGSGRSRAVSRAEAEGGYVLVGAAPVPRGAFLSLASTST